MSSMANKGRSNRRREVVIITVKHSYAITELLRTCDRERSGGIRLCKSLLSFFFAREFCLCY